MTIYVMKNGELVEKVIMEINASPNLIGDEIPLTRHMANGKYYTSKAKFREATRAANCVEIGNENPFRPRPKMPLDRRRRREDIRKAISDIKEGRAPSIRQLIEMNKE
jgi:hypothetical protein